MLVVGYERMNGLPTAEVGDVLLKCAYVKEEASTTGFAGVFAGIAQQYFDKYGDAADINFHCLASRSRPRNVSRPRGAPVAASDETAGCSALPVA